jgi:hypothetical protein
MFTNEQLEKLSDWEPILDLFINPSFKDTDEVIQYFQTIVVASLKSEGINFAITEEGMYGSYYSLFIPELNREIMNRIEGYEFSFSILAPYAVLSKSSVYKSKTVVSYNGIDFKNLLSPKKVRTPIHEHLCRLSKGYTFLTTEQANCPVPEKYKPMDWCLAPEPWNKTHNLLFQNTD